MIEFVLAGLLAFYMIWFGIKEINRDKEFMHAVNNRNIRNK